MIRPVRRTAIPILLPLLFVTACAGMPPAAESAFAREALPLIETGITDIHDIYIDPIDTAEVTRAGIDSLGTLDPKIALSWRDDEVTLFHDGTDVHEADIPDGDAPADWARLAGDVLVRAHKASPALQAESNERIFEAFFDAALQNLDRYSRYAGPDDAAENRAGREGFGGIGITIEAHPDGAIIEDVARDRPAEAAGLLVGDRIVAVDDKAIAGYPIRRVATLLRGPVDETVRLKVARNGLAEPFSILVGRTRIIPDTVFFESRGRHALIRISTFNKRTAKRMAEAVGQARAELGPRLNGLVIDLRGNPGGLLDQAVDTADLFLEDGLISKAEGRHPDSLQMFTAEPGDIADGLPIVVLLNGASASAAEILAAALQDHGRAVVVGMTSFGKGTIQTVLTLPNDGELYLTWARFVAPSGYALDHLGVVPTICTTETSDAVRTLDRAFEDGNRSAARILTARRQVDPDEASSVDLVRDLCPWKPHESGDIDYGVAELLLDSPVLYRTAIAIAAPPQG